MLILLLGTRFGPPLDIVVQGMA